MTKRVRELLEKRNDAAEAIETAKRQIAELTARGDDLREKISGLTKSIREARTSKAKAVETYASSMNEAAKSALDKAKQKLRDVENVEAELSEMVASVERKKASLVESLPKLEQALKASEVEIWQEIYRDLSSRITDSVKEDVAKIFVAGCAGDCVNSYQDFINNLFPCPGKGLLVKNNLEREHCEVQE